ncbi:MAG: hypothetical protein CM15mP39_07140 [Synechococcus sp.]|nr:MAG: hypothetical protein CM15mP39_07140 [Synechococcus sp.]
MVKRLPRHWSLPSMRALQTAQALNSPNTVASFLGPSLPPQKWPTPRGPPADAVMRLGLGSSPFERLWPCIGILNLEAFAMAAPGQQPDAPNRLSGEKKGVHAKIRKLPDSLPGGVSPLLPTAPQRPCHQRLGSRRQMRRQLSVVPARKYSLGLRENCLDFPKPFFMA